MSERDYTHAFVLRGKNRRAILRALKWGKQTPAQLHHHTGLYRSHVKRTLDELLARRLVQCLNPNDRTHKLYVLTAEGAAALAALAKQA